VFASRHFFEITDSKVNKGTATQHLFHLVPHLKEYKVWAAGDAPSDAMMKPFVDAFAAPVDAHPTVLSVTDVTFPSAKEEGITQFLASLKTQ
jgi:hydroxymethylpyrimidine pyrophosphatase-like HAD family hydrolase